MEQQSTPHSPTQERLRAEAIARQARWGTAVKQPVVALKPLPPPSINATSKAYEEHSRKVQAGMMKRRNVLEAIYQPPSVPSPQELVQGLLVGRLNFHKIIAVVARAHGIATDDVLLHHRKPELIDAKSHLVWVLERETGFPTTMMGQLLDLDHSTIIHHRKRFHTRAEKISERAKAVDAALDLLRKRSAPIGSPQLALDLVSA